MNTALAIDIGGTKIAAAVVSAEGRLLDVSEVATPVGDGPEAAALALERVVRRVLGSAAVTAVGVCCAGPVDLRRGTASPVNIAEWRAFPLVERVAQLVPSVPIAFAGDGVALAAGERSYGAARDLRDALCVTVSTGVGAGLIVDGRVRLGPSGDAGHLGHVVVDLDGPPCGCGGRGCVEAFACGPAMLSWAVGEGWTPPREPATAADLAESARRGDRVAMAAFDRGARALAAGIANAAALADLPVAVVGGGVAQAGEILFGPLRRHLFGYTRLPFRDVQVVRSELGRTAGLLGAAALALSPTTRAP